MSVARMLAMAAPLFQRRLPQVCAQMHLLAAPLPSTPSTAPSLLQPQCLQVVPVCGLKQKGLLKRRCADCYFVYRDKRKYVMCSKNPRHKAMAFAPREKFTWVLSPGPMQSKQRPW